MANKNARRTMSVGQINNCKTCWQTGRIDDKQGSIPCPSCHVWRTEVMLMDIEQDYEINEDGELIY